jgi:hypothetical protein
MTKEQYAAHLGEEEWEDWLTPKAIKGMVKKPKGGGQY